jgi:hypothetical protein
VRTRPRSVSMATRDPQALGRSGRSRRPIRNRSYPPSKSDVLIDWLVRFGQYDMAKPLGSAYTRLYVNCHSRSRSVGFATLLRYGDYSSIWVLMISAAGLLLTTFVLFRYIPQRFLGQDGLWILQVLTANLPIRINRSRSLGQTLDH